MSDIGVAVTAVVTFLGGSAALVTIALKVVQHWLELRVTAPIKAAFDERLAKQRREFEKEMAYRQEEIQKDLKRFDKLLEKESKDEETIQTIEQLEYPILNEADRILRRVSEVMKEEYLEMYDAEWAAADLKLEDLNGNKKVTAVYRLMRLFGFYALYLQRSAGLPSQRLRGRLRFYIENKLDPVFASGEMFPRPIMFRDMILELSESMLNKSEKWDVVTVIGFTEWMEACRSEKGVIPLMAKELSDLFTCPNPRVAMLGVYLIDLRQDTLKNQTYESSRTHILDWLQRNIDPDSVSVWGFTRDKQTDLRAMDISKGKIPRNIRSHLYDIDRNPMNYNLPERQVSAPPLGAAVQ